MSHFDGIFIDGKVHLTGHALPPVLQAPIKLSHPIACDHCRERHDTLFWLDAGGWLVCGACATKHRPAGFSLETK